MADTICRIDTDSVLDMKSYLTALESGKVLFLPEYHYIPAQASLFLLENVLDNRHKNISFHPITQKLGGFDKKQHSLEIEHSLCALLQGFYDFSRKIIDRILPRYSPFLQIGRTSFRPREIQGRKSSKRKDDTRLHVDAFPSQPVHGFRILRIFCNINPQGKPRIWHLGEPFLKVAKHFSSHLPPYKPWLAKLYHRIHITKSLRSEYDHYQLHLHDAMKLDDRYQATVDKTVFAFPAKSTWLVFTDAVSHAALKGQFLLEQTFYVPVEAMEEPALSPLSTWEQILGHGLEK